MSKLRVHYQTVPGWAEKYQNDWHKVIDPDWNYWPGKKTIGRVFIPDGEANALILRGRAGAETYYERCRPMYERAPWIYAWEAPNEPPVATPMQRECLVEFTIRWTELMHAAGRRVVVLCLSVGWTDIGAAPSLAGALEKADFWALHEYSAPDMRTNTTWLCFRYRRTVLELRAAGARIPPLLVTECGIDGGVLNAGRRGWKSYTDLEGYKRDLEWYNAGLLDDDYVVAAHVFTAGPNADWMDYEVPEELVAWLPTLPGTPSFEEPKPMPALDFPVLLWPVQGGAGIVSQEFGENPANYAMFGLAGHNGRDITVIPYRQDTPPALVAPLPGECWPYYDDGGYGYTCEVWYPSIQNPIIKIILAHMTGWPQVDTRQRVQAGDVLGFMGWTGNVDPDGPGGAHTHFGVKHQRNGSINPGYRGWIDPRFYMER